MIAMTPRGVLAPIPTPIDDGDRVRTEWLRDALAHWMPTPLTGFVVLGTNGEAPLLDEDESDEVIGTARDCVPSNRLFVVGTGRESTRATIAASRRAAALGADMVMVRTPGFFKPQMTTDAFVQHYRAVADESPVPVLLYNFTAVTGVNLPLSAAAVLAQHPNITGMKESSGDVAQIADFVSQTPDRFHVLAGSSRTFYAALCAGASGGVLALAAVLPDACVQLYDLTRQRNHAAAQALQLRLIPVGRLLGSLGAAGLKAALRLTGCEAGVPRRPLLPVDPDGVVALKAALAQFQEVRA
jgi:4-hydroxy-2-oxoglutarate aldolase